MAFEKARSVCEEEHMDEIKPGDVVQLKSGGPKKTVAVVKEGRAWCDWFEGLKQHQGSFPVSSLMKIPGR